MLLLSTGAGHSRIRDDAAFTPLAIGEPRTIADSVVQPSPFMVQPVQPTRIAVTPDGSRLLVQVPPDPSLRQLTLLLGWQRRVGGASRRP